MLFRKKSSQETDSSLIDISDLPKEKVIHALFKNVYRKSLASQKVWWNIKASDLKLDAPGIDSPPEYEEILSMLSENSHIDYIGCVKININFEKNIIDASLYDLEHQTNTTANVETASQCIKELRLAEEESKNFHLRVTEEKKLQKLAGQLIMKITGHTHCEMGYWGVLDFTPLLSNTDGLIYAKKLKDVGLSVKIIKKNSGYASNGITSPLITIEISDPLPKIVDELNAYVSNGFKRKRCRGCIIS